MRRSSSSSSAIDDRHRQLQQQQRLHRQQQHRTTSTISSTTTTTTPTTTTTTTNGVANGRTSRLLRSRSGIESPRSLDSMRNRQIPSPLRTPKSIQSPILDSGDDGSIRIDRATFQYMCQDIVSLKTMLLKLKRVLQESGENGLTRPEALNPFDNSMKNGLFYALNEGGTADVSTSPGSGGNSIADELTDLRRQVIFLQGQVEDRDRSIQVLQFQLAKLKTSNGTETTNNALSVNGNKTSSSVDTCNATTQTEKQSRPVSAGPSLLQSLPQDNVMGPLVSWSDSWDCQHPTMLGEPKSNRNFRKSDDRSPFAPESRHSQSQIVKPDARRNFTRKSFGQENI